MRFRANGKEYRGALAAEVVRQIERDTSEYPYPGGTLRQFILWSLLMGLPARVSLNELGLSDSLSEEMLALCYLFLCDQYGLGDLEDALDFTAWREARADAPRCERR